MLEDSSKTVVTVMGLKRKAEAGLPADFSAAQNIGTVALQKSERFPNCICAFFALKNFLILE